MLSIGSKGLKQAHAVTQGGQIMYFDAIAKIVAQRTGCDVSAVKPESTFSELGIDSLDTVELLMNLEDEIGIEIELDQKVETVDDLDKFIQSIKG
jgi:acyl carrier protein